MEYGQALKIAGELEYYSGLQKTHESEYWGHLSSLCSYMYSSASDMFREAYEKEITEQLEFIKENYDVIKEVKTFERKVEYLKFREYEYGN